MHMSPAERSAHGRAPKEHGPLQAHDSHTDEAPVPLADLVAALQDLPGAGAVSGLMETRRPRG